jgi:hypothetical protein
LDQYETREISLGDIEGRNLSRANIGGPFQ